LRSFMFVIVVVRSESESCYRDGKEREVVESSKEE
jgi:hypothetical protein